MRDFFNPTQTLLMRMHFFECWQRKSQGDDHCFALQVICRRSRADTFARFQEGKGTFAEVVQSVTDGFFFSQFCAAGILPASIASIRNPVGILWRNLAEKNHLQKGTSFLGGNAVKFFHLRTPMVAAKLAPFRGGCSFNGSSFTQRAASATETP